MTAPTSLVTRPLHEHFGLEVLDVDAASLDEGGLDALLALWAREPLLLLRGQCLSESELVGLSRHFGEPDVILRDDMLSAEHPEIIYVTHLLRPDGSRLGGLGSYELNWHTDQIYRPAPPTGSIYYAVEMPAGQGRTSWCNMQLAYENLPDALRETVDGRRACYKYGTRPEAGFQRDIDDTQAVDRMHERTPAVSHPLVLVQPETGRRSLYLDPKKLVSIDGFDEAGSAELAETLVEHAIRAEFSYTHDWRNGDLVFWDNARLLHKRDAFDERFPRLGKRTTLRMDPARFAVP